MISLGVWKRAVFEETYVSGNEDGSLLAALGNVGCENDRGKQLAVTMKDPPAIDSQATPPIWASSPDGLPGISLRVMQLSRAGSAGAHASMTMQYSLLAELVGRHCG